MTEIEKAKQFFLDGIARMEREEFSVAEHAFRKALTLAPDRASIITNLTAALIKQHKYQEAKALAIQSIAIDPANAEGYLNLGLCHAQMREHEAAIANFDKALAIAPDYAEAWLNRGAALKEGKRFAEALACCDQVLDTRPDMASAYYNRGLIFVEIGNTEEALENFDKAINLDPEIDFCIGVWLSAKMKLCEWNGIGQALVEINKRVVSGKMAVDPFAFLGMTGAPAAQKRCAEIYSSTIPRLEGNNALHQSKPRHDRGARLKIAYFSADFHNHPGMASMAEMFELHDKDKFETFAFSYGPDINDYLRQRVSKSFDHFMDVRDLTDRQVIDMARDQKIDIAIHRNGYTKFSRDAIFAAQVAPIQVNFLGYAGTLGAEYIDYIIADPILIPETHRIYYSEKVAYLPHTYGPTDRQRKISERVFSREELGLPVSGFVFCCFNNNYKIVPDVFDIWMRLLVQVPGSVLWLLEGSANVRRNLQQEAEKRGVAAERLIFAKRIDRDEHLARHRQADLFLDTFDFNAHATASDALWAGLPLVTCMGESFASRVAASYLNAIELPELITKTRQDYEALALDLASNPDRMIAVREKLRQNRLTAPYFNSPLYTRHLEKSFEMMWDRYQQGLAPDHIFVPDLGAGGGK